LLKVRIIPTLLYKGAGLVKGTGFDSWRNVGSAMQAIKVYNLREVDELVFFDITATAERRPPDFDLIDDLADDCFMPLTVGGGVACLEDAQDLLAVGADKVCLSTAAAERPELVGAIAKRFGAQCVVVSVDAKETAPGEHRVTSRCGKKMHDETPAAFAARMEGMGAGEILVQSVDRDGTMAGYDIPLIRSVAGAVSIPVIASGGAGSYADLAAAVREGGASAVAAAAMFHFTEQTPLEAKRYLAAQGIPVRL
jgi:cyclase